MSLASTVCDQDSQELFANQVSWFLSDHHFAAWAVHSIRTPALGPSIQRAKLAQRENGSGEIRDRITPDIGRNRLPSVTNLTIA
jgi:hypothetical protein